MGLISTLKYELSEFQKEQKEKKKRKEELKLIKTHEYYAKKAELERKKELDEYEAEKKKRAAEIRRAKEKGREKARRVVERSTITGRATQAGRDITKAVRVGGEVLEGTIDAVDTGVKEFDKGMAAAFGVKKKPTTRKVSSKRRPASKTKRVSVRPVPTQYLYMVPAASLPPTKSVAKPRRRKAKKPKEFQFS